MLLQKRGQTKEEEGGPRTRRKRRKEGGGEEEKGRRNRREEQKKEGRKGRLVKLRNFFFQLMPYTWEIPFDYLDRSYQL